jgi:hypothetical protein
VPTWTTALPLRTRYAPLWLAWFSWLPEAKISRMTLTAGVLLHAATGPDDLRVEHVARQLAVVGKGPHFVHHLAVDDIGVSLVHQLPDHVELIIHEISRPCVRRIIFDMQKPAVLAERGDVALGKIARAFMRRGTRDDAVIDVCVVDDGQDVIAAVLKVAPEQIPKTVRASVPDMNGCLCGKPASINAHDLRMKGLERLFLLGQRVVNDQRHGP